MSPPAEFLSTVQALVQCYQAFEAHSAAHIRTLGLTPPQFDIVATLGNTPGMTATELGERTLITKGTLTGVVDRLVDRGWVERAAHASDRRCQIIRLTQAGEALFVPGVDGRDPRQQHEQGGGDLHVAGICQLAGDPGDVVVADEGLGSEGSANASQIACHSSYWVTLSTPEVVTNSE